MAIEITAVEIALANGIDPKRYRQALRKANFAWYRWGARWTVVEDSAQHRDMLSVIASVCGGSDVSGCVSERSARAQINADRDEGYVIDLCDQVLGVEARRQHRFDFLRGDVGPNGFSRRLPVDAWYPSLKLVVEYRERQHSEEVAFFDRRETISGMGRGAQRAHYDQIRREILPHHHIKLIEIDYSEFTHRSNKRLVRCDDDTIVIKGRLAEFV